MHFSLGSLLHGDMMVPLGTHLFANKTWCLAKTALPAVCVLFQLPSEPSERDCLSEATELFCQALELDV